MTTGSVGQGGVEVLFRVQPVAEVAQAGVEYAHRVQPLSGVTQAGVEFLHRVQTVNGVTQAGVEYLFKAVTCDTKWCQVWRVERRDGEVYRFTSLDRDITWRGETYEACNSFDPSAAESSDEVGGVGNMDLAGILSSSSIDPADVYGGRFNGAYVEAWLIAWESQGETPQRLLAGTWGNVEFSDTGFKVELAGDGARLQQTPLLDVYTPSCRWEFGSTECGVDLGPLTVTGTVDTGGARAFIDVDRAEAAGYFSRGRVTFTSGANDGLTAEIREHAAGGVFTLWPRLAGDIEAGDTYSMTPGCSLMYEADGGTNGCIAWANVINYGGFPTVPGQDAIIETPDVK